MAGGMSKQRLIVRMRLSRSSFDAASTVLALVGFLGVSFAAGGMAEHLGYGDTGILADMKRALAEASVGARLALVAGIGIAAGIGEELLFLVRRDVWRVAGICDLWHCVRHRRRLDPLTREL